MYAHRTIPTEDVDKMVKIANEAGLRGRRVVIHYVPPTTGTQTALFMVEQVPNHRTGTDS